MSDENKKINRDRILALLKRAGNYSCRANCHLRNFGKVNTREEYERRAFNNPLRPEDVQVLRYLARMDYADIYLILMAAEAMKSEKTFNGVIDQMYINQILRKLSDIGMVVSRRYVNDRDVDEKGRVLVTDPVPTFYCLTSFGQRQYKDVTSSREFLEEFLFQKADLEVMRRMASNYAVLKCQKQFKGDFSTMYSSKLEDFGRLPLYGRLENDTEYVFFEPVFFNYDPLYVREAEFQGYLSARAAFVEKYFEGMDHSKRRSIVFLVESIDHMKDAVLAYKNVLAKVPNAYVTSENVLGTVYAQDKSVLNAFLSVEIVTQDGEEKIKANAEVPVFYKEV